jgi:signal transduction histidine kinase
VVKLLGQDLLANEISVKAEYQQDLPQIHADQLQLEQVVMNLITNAIDAMKSQPPTKRRLWLTTGLKNNSMVCLLVRDSGSGVPAGNQERIFDPFYTTKLSGTGLGLAICRKIIESHGGTLRLAETSSQGSVFEIDLPRARAEIDRIETVQAETAPHEDELARL